MSCLFFRTLRTLLISAVLSVASLGPPLPVKTQITFNVFVDPHPVVSGGTTGFAFAGNKFVGSTQGDGTGVLYQTDLNGGNVKLFAPGVSVPSGSIDAEHFVASSLGFGGFPLSDIYVGAGTAVLHITNDGNHSNILVTGLASPVRGMLFDAVGTFGHDLLVCTHGGEVYRVKSSGAATLLANVGEDTEGMDIAPLNGGFSSFDGQLIIVSENSGLIRAISASGVVTVLNKANPIPRPENLTFVPFDLGTSGDSVEGFYGANYPQNVLKATPDQFRSFRGDAIVRSELTPDHRISRVHWNGSTFEITIVGTVTGEPEDALFVDAARLNPPCVRTSHKDH
jgi:hypothetical protein